MKALALASAALMLLAACGQPSRHDAPVARRYAYPRVELPDSARQVIAVDGLGIALSTSAKASQPRHDWLTARYPSLGATLHLSVSRFGSDDALASAIANRRQRIALNTGGARPRTDNFNTPCGWLCERVTAPEGSATPVQLLAIGPGRTLVSAAFALDGATAPADSLRPIVEALDTEAMHIADSLR